MKAVIRGKKNKFDDSIIENSANQTQAIENKDYSSFVVNCSQCRKSKVIVKWNKPKKKYSDKQNLGYYTEREEDKDKYWCQKCIFQLYYQKKSTYWRLVPNLKKRQILRSYIYLKSLEVKG